MSKTLLSSAIKSTSQNRAYEEILKQLQNVVTKELAWENQISLTGAAGTGKTYLTTKLIKALQDTFDITITAPTHKALQVLRANLIAEGVSGAKTQTIQSFLNIKLVKDLDKGIEKFSYNDTNSKESLSTDILIVDESSMVSTELYEYIMKAIESLRVKAVLFVGDKYQLLPIDNNHSKAFELESQFKLTKIVRQAQDSYIIHMATKAREIIKSKKYFSLRDFFEDDSFKHNIAFFQSEKEFYDDFCTPDTWANEDKVIASFTNQSVNHHNNTIRRRYWHQQNITDIPFLRQGDKVIFQEANVINNIVVHNNSDIVKIQSAKALFDEKLKLHIWECEDISGSPFNVIDPQSKGRLSALLDKVSSLARAEKDKQERKKRWKLFFMLKEMFVEVKYIYASTIHKLQGSTYKSVYIDLRDIETLKDADLLYRLLYVAITRASLNVKILLPDNQKVMLKEYQAQTLSALHQGFDAIDL